MGIPFVIALGLLSRKRTLLPKGIRSIGILGNAAIGDTVISSAAVLDIRTALPDANLFFFAPGADSDMICGMISGLDYVVPIRMNHPFETIRTIRRYGPFDLWLDFGPWPRANAVISFSAPALLRVGFKTPGQYRHWVYDRTANHGRDVHEVHNYRRLLAVSGISGSHIPALKLPRTNSRISRVVMHVWPGGSAAAVKMWPETHWIALIDHVTSAGMTVVLTGSGYDWEQLEKLRSHCHSPALIDNVAGCLSLVEITELLAASAAVISVDTGIMHLAAALDCRLVALFGATSPRRWGPLNTNARVLYSARDCSPCVSLGLEKGCGLNRCMIDLTPEMVVTELDALTAQA